MRELDIMNSLIELGYTYNPITGDCYKPNGRLIKTFDGKYLRFSQRLLGKDYFVRCHRFAFFYVNRKLPRMIDHINQNKLDNRIINLRDGSGSVNIRNTERVKSAKGYWFRSDVNLWVASIKINYKSKHIGYFRTEHEAHQAYLDELSRLS